MSPKHFLKEIEMGRIAGPFNERPFTNWRLSPIGVVRKNLHPQHLSFPLGKSVNDGIDPVFSTVQYTSFDKVLDSVAKLGRNTLLAKMDILSAFRLLILHPSDFELFGFKFKNQFYFDKCLPMGCSVSCSLFEKFASFLEWALRSA